MKKACHLPLGILLACAAAPATANIDIVFDYTYSSTFIGNIQKSLLDAAASALEARITDNLGAIEPQDGEQFTLNFFDPTDNIHRSIDSPIAANEFRVYIGARSMSGSTLGLGGPGSFIFGGDQDFMDSVSRGQAGYTPQDNNHANDSDFAPWGGAISFNSTYANWYFDVDPTTTESFAGKVDFYSVAIHELAHVLGFGTADSWNNQVSGGFFTGVHSGMVALSNDDSHWADGTQSPINGLGSFEAAMDPIISTGSRKVMTDLDWNGLRDVGWQVSAVPEPETWGLLLVGLGLVATAARKRAV